MEKSTEKRQLINKVIIFVRYFIMNFLVKRRYTLTVVTYQRNDQWGAAHKGLKAVPTIRQTNR